MSRAAMFLLSNGCALLALVAMGLFGFSIWQACGIPGDDVWGERAVGALVFGVLMFWFSILIDE